MVFHLYYRNSHIQFETSPEINTYGQLQALVLNYVRLPLNYFQALMYNYQIVGEHLEFDRAVDFSNITHVLQVIVNYFPEEPSRIMYDYERWLRRKVVSETNLHISRLYLNLLVENPLSLMTVVDHYHNNTQRQDANQATVTDAFYYDFYNRRPVAAENRNEAENTTRRAPHGTGRPYGVLPNNTQGAFALIYNSMFNTQGNTMQDILEALAPSVSVTLDQETLNRLRVQPYRELDLNNSVGNVDQCTICRENYLDDDSIRSLNCRHIFHKDCIDQWLTTQSVYCPVCRTDTRIGI